MLRKKNNNGGYLPQIANNYIDKEKEIQSLSIELEPQIKFENGKPTGEVIAYKGWFSQAGLPPFQVKFDSKVNLPSYSSIVEFEQLEACEVGFNVYFRATDLKEVK